MKLASNQIILNSQRRYDSANDFDLEEKWSIFALKSEPSVSLCLLFAFFYSSEPFFILFFYESLVLMDFVYFRKKEHILSASATNFRRLPIKIYICR